MDLITAITPEGTTTPQINAYVVFERSTAVAKEALDVLLDRNYDAYELTQPDERWAVWGVECECTTLLDFYETCGRLLARATEATAVVRCVLMFDGVYDGIDSLLTNRYSDSIYGIAGKEIGPLLCFELDILQAACWRELLSVAMERCDRSE
ncbi:MAG: hypothetical protein U0894_09035 [Pirellulales bacterium]